MFRALVRGVPTSFAAATVAKQSEDAIDVGCARDQHVGYVSALERAGVEVSQLPLENQLADSCFVEDQAVVQEGHALITRSGCASRRPEAEGVSRALAPHVTLHTMEAPATLDGGDVLTLGKTLFVGRSERTNAAGIERLAEVFTPLHYAVVPVHLGPGVLHLKCVCSPLGSRRVLVAEGALSASLFDGIAEVVWIPAGEAYAANVVAVGATVLVAEGYPGTVAALRAAGLLPVVLPTTEFAKADGSLTCLSVFY